MGPPLWHLAPSTHPAAYLKKPLRPWPLPRVAVRAYVVDLLQPRAHKRASCGRDAASVDLLREYYAESPHEER